MFKKFVAIGAAVMTLTASVLINGLTSMVYAQEGVLMSDINDYMSVSSGNYDLNNEKEISVVVSQGTIWEGTFPEVKSDYDFSGGSGVENDPYLISSAMDMAYLSVNVDSGINYENNYFELTEDIDLGNHEWEPIGGHIYGYEFRGVFDGKGYEVTGLYLYNTEDYQGLFGNTGANCIIKNLSITGNVVGGNYVGMVAGFSYGSIEECSSIGMVTGTDSVGGLAGFISGATVINCSNYSDVLATDGSAGGITGGNNNGIYNCINEGNVEGSKAVGGITGSGGADNCHNNGMISGESEVGGISGSAYRTINECSNSGEVKGTDSIGGIVGKCLYPTISNCYNTASISGNGYYVGGIVGRNEKGTIIYSFNTGEITGDRFGVGGIIGSNLEGIVEDCYNTGSITGNSNVGGILGSNLIPLSGSSSDSILSNCYNTGNICGELTVGGVVGSNSSITENVFYPKASNCVSLGAVISGDRVIGRIAGVNNGFFGNNYARVDQIINTSGKESLVSATDTTSVNGADIAINGSNSMSELFSVKLTWDMDTWAISDDPLEAGAALPTLKSIPVDQNPILPAAKEMEYFPFTDVTTDKNNGNYWMYSGIKYVYQKGIMTGKSDDEFDPTGHLTRAEFTTTLYSMSGKPQITYQNTFRDVPDKQWYTSPVIWASANGITNGYPNGNFGVSDNITREQLALMMYKYATEVCGYEVSINNGVLSSYSDYELVNEWAENAMQWAVTNGVISGTGDGRLNPQGNATRAECAAILRTFCNVYSN